MKRNGGSFLLRCGNPFGYNGFVKKQGGLFYVNAKLCLSRFIIIFGYVIVGYVAGKKNLITKEQQRYLSKLVSSLILPFTVLSASSMEASGQDIVNVAIAVALLFSCMALTSAGCMLYAKIKQVPEKACSLHETLHIS